MAGAKATEATRREGILRAAYDVALRRGIDGLTLRAVAARARLSHGSVLFHFKRKEQLGLALLDRVLATTLPPGILDVVETIPDPRERLLALFRQETARLAAEPRTVRLLLEYWSRGAHNAMIRKKLSAALEEYRAGFARVAEAALRGKAGGRGATPDGVAATAVSLILGYPVQVMIDSGQLDEAGYLASAQGILGVSSTPTSTRS
jgi:TetR/AcrR family transcriptional regulator, transcriptional repressor of bet genes